MGTCWGCVFSGGFLVLLWGVCRIAASCVAAARTRAMRRAAGPASRTERARRGADRLLDRALRGC